MLVIKSEINQRWDLYVNLCQNALKRVFCKCYHVISCLEIEIKFIGELCTLFKKYLCVGIYYKKIIRIFINNQLKHINYEHSEMFVSRLSVSSYD